MKRLVGTFIWMGLLLAALSAPASADLLYGHFGVTLTLGDPQTDVFNGGVYYPFAEDALEPTLHLDTTDYVIDDWYGSWSFTHISRVQSGAGAGTVPTGGEPYDVEAIYMDDTVREVLICIVTSYEPPPGYYEPRAGNELIVAGDLALDLGLNDEYTDGFSYDYGVNINPENRQGAEENATSGGSTIGESIYRTENDDWYLGSPENDVAAGGELTNFDPEWTGFGGDYVGDVDVSYYEYTFDGGLEECRAPTYIIEVRIPKAALGNPVRGDQIGVSWVEGCRNDGNATDHVIRLYDDIDVPEPGTLVLTGLGALAMGWYRRRRAA